MDKISHKKSIFLMLFGGIIATAVSIIGGLFLWSWTYLYVTDRLPNPHDPKIYFLPALLASLVSFFLLGKSMAKYAGRFGIYYLCGPLLLSCITLFIGHEPSYPVLHNLAILFAMVLGGFVGLKRGQYLTSKG